MKTHKHAPALAKQMEAVENLPLSRAGLDLTPPILRSKADRIARAAR